MNLAKRCIVIASTFICLFLTNFFAPCYGYYYSNDNYAEQGENYLQITQIERTLFNRSYENENIYSRLNRIEEKLFKTTNNGANLSDRLDNILSVINPAMFANIPLDGVTAMEKNIFKQVYISDVPDARLARLEQAVFGTIQAGDLDSRYRKLQIALNSCTSPVNTYANYYTIKTGNRVKDIVQNILGGMGNITGITAPVYDPFDSYYNTYYPGNYGYNRFYRNNNAVYNAFRNYGSASNIRVLD